jgi:hypothetical protein
VLSPVAILQKRYYLLRNCFKAVFNLRQHPLSPREGPDTVHLSDHVTSSDLPVNSLIVYFTLFEYRTDRKL